MRNVPFSLSLTLSIFVRTWLTILTKNVTKIKLFSVLVDLMTHTFKNVMWTERMNWFIAFLFIETIIMTAHLHSIYYDDEKFIWAASSSVCCIKLVVNAVAAAVRTHFVQFFHTNKHKASILQRLFVSLPAYCCRKQVAHSFHFHS